MMYAVECKMKRPDQARQRRPGLTTGKEWLMSNSTCVITDCDKPVKGRSMCSSHYNKWRNENSKRGPCSVVGCDNKGTGGRGFCPMHYQRWRTHGHPGGPERIIGVNKGKTCQGPDCDKPPHAKGLCQGHWKQDRKGLELSPLRDRSTYGMTTIERLRHYTAEAGSGGCREWTGNSFCRGYPYLGERFMGTKFPHRMVYMLALGEEIPSHVPVHHKCGNTRCVEPSHLQAVTTIENTAEMMERNHYLGRIAALESALADVFPNHPLLEPTK